MALLKSLLFIVSLLWVIWAGIAIYLVQKLLEKDLLYLLEPNVNVLSSNNSCSRYDQSKLKKWKIYLGAIFLVPPRLVALVVLLPIGFSISAFVYIIFCSNTPILFTLRQ